MTYAEHEASWRALGTCVEIVDEMAALEAFEVAIVVNPNNPDGRLTSPDALAELSARLAGKGGMLVVDEAFMEVETFEKSLVPKLPPAGAVVLRSFGKFLWTRWRAARLCGRIAPAGSRSVARSALGPSPGPAIEIGRAALADREWRDRAIGRLAGGAARLDFMLRHAGFEIVGGTLLFRLARRAEASAWFERLGRQAILVRPFPAPHADWLRFGLPGTASEWRRLEAALSE